MSEGFEPGPVGVDVVASNDVTDRDARLLGRTKVLDSAGVVISPSLESTEVKQVPIQKGNIFNTALPAAEANLFGTDLSPTNIPTHFRIYAVITVAGILRVARTNTAVTVTEDLKDGGNLTANAANIFDILVSSGDTINLRYSVTTGTIKKLQVVEITSGA